MYIPARFAETDRDKILEFIEQNNFAILVSDDGEKPVATHVPVVIESGEENRLYISGHLARQWAMENI